jgi:hypothetical protein
MTRTEPLLKLKPGKEKSLRRRHPCRAAAHHGHALAGFVRRDLRLDPTFFPPAIHNRTFD